MTTPTAPLHAARHWLLAGCIALWVAMFVATHVPLPELPEVPGEDKTFHAITYLLLAAAMVLMLAARGHARRGRLAIAAVALPVYATMDELTQHFVNRYPSLGDWLADVAGVAAGIVLVEAALCLWGRKRPAAKEEAT